MTKRWPGQNARRQIDERNQAAPRPRRSAFGAAAKGHSLEASQLECAARGSWRKFPDMARNGARLPEPLPVQELAHHPEILTFERPHIGKRHHHMAFWPEDRTQRSQVLERMTGVFKNVA